MTEYEIGSLLSETFDHSSGIFEYWMTLSFAAVVAAAFAAEKLHRNYIRLLAFGYFLASLFLFLVRIYSSLQALDLLEMLEAGGYDTTRFDNSFGLLVGVYAHVLHVIVTFGVLVYMLRVNRAENE